MPRGGIVPPTPVLAPGSALRSRPRVALSSAQVPPLYSSPRPSDNSRLGAAALSASRRRAAPWPLPASSSAPTRSPSHDRPVVRGRRSRLCCAGERCCRPRPNSLVTRGHFGPGRPAESHRRLVVAKVESSATRPHPLDFKEFLCRETLSQNLELVRRVSQQGYRDTSLNPCACQGFLQMAPGSTTSG